MTDSRAAAAGSSWSNETAKTAADGALDSRESRLERARAALRKVEARQDMHSTPGRTLDREALKMSPVQAYGVYHVPPTVEGVLRALSRAMRSSGWAAVVGIQDVGWEAAERLGVDTRRVAIIPDVKEEPHRVLGALVEGFEIVVLGNVSVAPQQQRALAARARKLSRTILITIPWQTVSKPFESSDRTGSERAAGFDVVEGRAAM